MRKRDLEKITAVVVGTVTDDTRMFAVPKINVSCALLQSFVFFGISNVWVLPLDSILQQGAALTSAGHFSLLLHFR